LHILCVGHRYDQEPMKITRKRLREIILEQLGVGPTPRFNVRNKTAWQDWVSELDDNESDIIDDEDEETIFEF